MGRRLFYLKYVDLGKLRHLFKTQTPCPEHRNSQHILHGLGQQLRKSLSKHSVFNLDLINRRGHQKKNLKKKMSRRVFFLHFHFNEASKNGAFNTFNLIQLIGMKPLQNGMCSVDQYAWMWVIARTHWKSESLFLTDGEICKSSKTRKPYLP